MVGTERDVILAADVGGTNARFAAFPAEDGNGRPAVEKTLPSRSGATFLDVLRAVLPSVPGRVVAASFGVAGPVQGGVCRATNLPWVVSAVDIAREMRLAQVGLFNDLEANAWGLAALGPDDLATIAVGRPEKDGATALLSAGTGLGAAGAVVVDGERRPFPSEGGHANFAPSDERQVRLWRRLAEHYGTVSWERVVSGSGLVAVYEFVRDDEGAADPPGVAAARDTPEHAAAIVAAASSGVAPAADHALDFFAELYGAQAGNIALTFLATGGVYLGGGLAPRLLKWLQRPSFRTAFLAKGRMRALLEAVPVHVILEPRTALLGAAMHARRILAR